MEGFGAKSQYGGDPNRPPFHRGPSRSSNGTSHGRAVSYSTNSSSTNLGSASSLKSSHSSHRNLHAGSGPTRDAYPDRPGSQLSRSTTEYSKMSDGRSSTPSVSNFLQERLQRERRFEAERSASRMSNELSASGELRAVHGSPVREKSSDSRRPRSSGGDSDQSKKTGMGVKEMEQTVSTLHKQNFDLKLELFHRRERQTELEVRLEKVESERSEVEEMNDQLVLELEKRDKAVEEAVAMIVVLEARVEQLLQEREMVRRVDAENFFYAQQKARRGLTEDNTTPKTSLHLPDLQYDPKTLARVPSFLSDQSGQTDNLRNVYLGARGSVISLPKTAEDTDQDNGGPTSGITSPSLSVLSESSFMSVYGQKDPGNLSSVPAEELSMLDEPTATGDGTSETSGVAYGPRRKPQIPKKSKENVKKAQGNGPAAFSSINHVLGAGASPLSKREKLEQSLTAMDDAPKPSSKDEGSVLRSPLRRSQQQRTKEEKREALRKVLTDAPYTKDFNNPHAFPPTPDTVSTAVLRRGQNSDETLDHQRIVGQDSCYLALSEETFSKAASQEAFVIDPKDSASQQAPGDLSSKRVFTGSSYLDNHIPVVQRPRSADESTISRKRANAWGSDSSDNEDAVSNYDYWLRESLRPNQIPTQDQVQRSGHMSPDLFGFPTGQNGWAMDAMFGSLGGSGYLGSAGGAPLSQTLDALGASLPRPQTGLYGSGLASPFVGGVINGSVPPPPPNRRSSLHAMTGSTSGSSTPIRSTHQNIGKVRISPVRALASTNRSRCNSTDSGMQQPRTHSLVQSSSSPLQQDGQQPLVPQKQRHYPPITGTGQPNRSRGLSNLFRRSIGSGEAPPKPPASAPPTQKAIAPPPKHGAIPLVGVPSWGRRPDQFVEVDRDSATPPPILRNRVPGRGSISAADDGAGAGAALMDYEDAEGGVLLNAASMAGEKDGLPVSSEVAPGDADTKANDVGGAIHAEGIGKRRWFGLGRKNSLRTT